MKTLTLILLSTILFACTRNQDTAPTPETSQEQSVAPKATGPSHEPVGGPLAITGLQLNYNSFSKLDSGAFSVEDLVIKKESNDEVVDQFDMLTWGPVELISDGQKLVVQPWPQFKITYTTDNGSVEKEFQCPKLDDMAVEQEVKKMIEKTKEADTDLEIAFFEIYNKARLGSPTAFSFFINPSEEQKNILKRADGGASPKSFITALTYLKQNGCTPAQ